MDSQSPVSSSCDDVDDPAAASTGAVDEIPIWVHGEQRWISGIAKDTTCAQLVDALLRDQGLKSAPMSAANTATMTAAVATSLTADHLGNQYVITERWKRVEQVLDHRTRILKIWEAWGETRPEVRSIFQFVFRHKKMYPSILLRHLLGKKNKKSFIRKTPGWAMSSKERRESENARVAV